MITQGTRDYNTSSNICVIWAPEGKEKEDGTKTGLKEIMAQFYTNLAKYINLQKKEATLTGKAYQTSEN